MNVGACKHRVGTGRAIVDSQTRSEPTRHACCVRERCNGRTVSGCGLNIVLSSRVQGAPLPQASGRRPGTHARGRRASCSRHACMRHRQHDAWHAQADALRVHAANAGARVCGCGHGAMCGTAPVHPYTPRHPCTHTHHTAPGVCVHNYVGWATVRPAAMMAEMMTVYALMHVMARLMVDFAL